MALSDCPKCWNTPCTCGYIGSKQEMMDEHKRKLNQEKKKADERWIHARKLKQEKKKADERWMHALKTITELKKEVSYLEALVKKLQSEKN